MPQSVRNLLVLLGITAFAIGFLRLTQDARLVHDGVGVRVAIECNQAVALTATPISAQSEAVNDCRATYVYKGLPFRSVVPHGLAATNGTVDAFVSPSSPDTPYIVAEDGVLLFAGISIGGIVLLFVLAAGEKRARRAKVKVQVRQTTLSRPPRRVVTPEERFGIRPDEGARAYGGSSALASSTPVNEESQGGAATVQAGAHLRP